MEERSRRNDRSALFWLKALPDVGPYIALQPHRNYRKNSCSPHKHKHSSSIIKQEQSTQCSSSKIRQEQDRRKICERYGVQQSPDGRREDIGELVGLLGEGGLNDDSIDVFEGGDFLECVVLGIIFQDLVEGVANQQGVLELG